MSTLSRREALTLAAAAPTGAALTLATSEPAAASTIPRKRLADAVQGPVALPGSALYSSGKKLFDPEFDARRPRAVVTAVSATDVSTTLQFARAHGLLVAARSGGHSYIGASAPTGAVVIDLRNLDAVSYDARSRRASVGGGARLYAVHTALAAHGRTIPTGTCPTVGVSGLASGGGIGPSSRAHGLTADAVVEAEVALPSGRRISANAARNADVFWALRGGGGGLVGIVTRWTFATHAATRAGTFSLQVPATRIENVIEGWARWVTTAPRSRWANLHLSRTAAGVQASFVGVTRDSDQRAAAASLLHACGVRATRESYASRSHMELVRYLGGGSTSPRTSFTAGSDVLATMNRATSTALARAIRTAPTGCTLLLDPLTGAVGDPATTATAFPYRNHLATVQWYTGRTDEAARRWIRAAHSTLGSHSAGRYINYAEPGVRRRVYLASNSARADAVRRRHDPRGTVRTSIA